MAAVVGVQGIHIAAAFVTGEREVLQIEPISIEFGPLLLPIADLLLVVIEVDKLLRARLGWSAQ